jgi:hypothetical protein
LFSLAVGNFLHYFDRLGDKKHLPFLPNPDRLEFLAATVCSFGRRSLVRPASTPATVCSYAHRSSGRHT